MKNKYVYVFLIVINLFIVFSLVNVKGQLHAFEELETVYLDIACSDRERFKKAINKHAGNFKAMDIEGLTIQKLEQAILSKCSPSKEDFK